MGRPLALHLAQAGLTLHPWARGSEFLDAPVSGGEPGAINASLTIMVGGCSDRANRQRDLPQRHGQGRFDRRAHTSGNPIDAAMIRVGFAGIGAGAARDCSSY
jgi:2-hydroxy-3-oxopropionate reductase